MTQLGYFGVANLYAALHARKNPLTKIYTLVHQEVVRRRPEIVLPRTESPSTRKEQTICRYARITGRRLLKARRPCRCVVPMHSNIRVWAVAVTTRMSDGRLALEVMANVQVDPPVAHVVGVGSNISRAIEEIAVVVPHHFRQRNCGVKHQIAVCFQWPAEFRRDTGNLRKLRSPAATGCGTSSFKATPWCKSTCKDRCLYNRLVSHSSERHLCVAPRTSTLNQGASKVRMAHNAP